MLIIIIRVFQKGYLLVSQLWLLFQKRALIDSHIIKTWTYIVGAESISRSPHLPPPINAPLRAPSQGWKGIGVNCCLSLGFVLWAVTRWWRHLKWPERLLVCIWAGAFLKQQPLSAHFSAFKDAGGGFSRPCHSVKTNILLLLYDQNMSWPHSWHGAQQKCLSSHVS